VSAPAFTKIFGMSIEEAVVFPKWIKERTAAAHLHSFHHSKITHWWLFLFKYSDIYLCYMK
jgi:hypothetical protein